MKPAHSSREYFRPVEVAGLEESAGLVGAVVEDYRRSHTLAAIAVDRGDVGAAHAVVLKPFEKRSDARFADPRLHQFTDSVVDHRGRNAGAQAETVGQVGRDVVFAAGDVNLHAAGFAKRD